ncbi:MAG: ATP-binding cassette domain-containing protein [Armatimonadetes bacterium]|nr:ATP-binding cassette domain-containing protein [Armatimonadota bacterium]
MTDSVAVEFKNVTYGITAPSRRGFRMGKDKSGAYRPIVKGLSFQIQSGETLVLLGRSGCGKTTTLKLINRLLVPDAGEVVVHGSPTTRWDPIRLRRKIGYVIQEVGLFPHLTVAENVGLVPTLDGWEAGRLAERVAGMLTLVGLDPDLFSRRYPRELSGGQRQRVGVARALAADPPILLMDEPFGALDPLTRTQIRREFRSLQGRLGKTVVFVTHDVMEAFEVASRIALLRGGELVTLSTPAEFASFPDSEVEAFTEYLRMESVDRGVS